MDYLENLGKLLWLTGPPGLGKSTTAQLLGRKHGYVYYEGDCFMSGKNPYIPLDAPNPSMVQVKQKFLRGKGAEERMKTLNGITSLFMDLMQGKGYDKELLKKFYTLQCEDILRERNRIGGDWAIATVSFTREMRDHIRYMK